MAGVRQHVETPTAVDRDAGFDRFYQEHYAWAVRVGHLLTGDRWTAEDVAQESFSRMHTRFGELDNPAAFLHTCVLNACRSLHRRKVREAERPRPPCPGPLHLEAMELLDALDRLPYRQKAVLVLRYYADLSEAEIASALDCRPGTVKSLAARGLAQLRKAIER
jgi:DNA-directed RNA polymerase specialized sigma24 family protein